MIRGILLFFAMSLTCVAQLERFATTNDGTRLFFVYSNRLAGTNQSFSSKLFSWDAEHGVQLVYESPAGSVHGISITGDGSLAAFTICCFAFLPPQGKGALLDLRTGHIEIAGTRTIISRNGRYLFTGDSLIDRIAGTSRPVSVQAGFVGSDGSLLYGAKDILHRIDPDGTDRIVARGLGDYSLQDADENTTTAILLRYSAPPLVVNTITGQQFDLGAAGAKVLASAFLSRDGQWVASVRRPSNSPEQVVLCRADATGCRTLTDPDLDAGPIAISGDAGAVYAISSQSRVLRIDTGTGRTERAFAFSFLTPSEPIVRGSLVRFSPVNPGNHITLNGREMPLFWPPGGVPVIQVPWDLPDQSATFTMYGGESPFETFTPQIFPVYDFFPQGFAPGDIRLNEGQPAYRENWSATTYQSPAIPGEIVHIYAIGLGAVDCPVETGMPAPLDRLCRATRAVDWKWETAPGTLVPAEVLFAGLAPGMVGLYQIDVRVPLNVVYAIVNLTGGGRTVTSVRVRQP